MWNEGRGWVLIAVSAGWFLSIGTRIAYPALIPFIRSDFGITLTTAGVLLTGMWIAYAFGQFPGGVLGDRYGVGNILVFSTALSTLAVVMLALSTNLAMLFVATVLFGLATALYGPLRVIIFTDIYPKRTGTAVGFTMAAGNIGNSVLPIVVGLLGAYATWRLGFGILVPCFVITTVGLWYLVPGGSPSGPIDAGDRSLRSIREFLGRTFQGGVTVVAAMQILLSFIYQGFVSFYPTYLTEVKGFPPELAASVFGLFFLCAIVVQPATGAFQDRIGTKRTLLALVTVFFLSLLALPLTDSLITIAAVTILLSSRTGTGVINNTFLAQALPEDIKSTGLGFVRTSWIAIGASAPLLIGTLGDRGALEEAFLFLAGVAGVALLLIAFLPSTEY